MWLKKHTMEDWRDLFAFNLSERRGIWLLLMLLCIVASANIILQRRKPKPSHVQLEILFAQGEQHLPGESDFPRRKPGRQGDPRKHPDSLFIFDPNLISAEAWIKLGLSEKQAEVITRYTRKGGRFKNPEDLKKSFVISDRFFEKVRPYIRIQNVPPVPAQEFGKGRHEAMVDLNLADTAELKKLRGIGTVLAARIVSYRKALGGFHSVGQLREVYGLPEEVFHQHAPRMKIAEGAITPIQVLKQSEKELSAHPYISKKLAYIIVSLREERPFQSKEELLSRLPAGIPVPEYLWPYLQF